MQFWVELKDHVPNGQTVTSLSRFNTFNTKQTYNESMSGGKGVAAVTVGFIFLVSIEFSASLVFSPLGIGF